MSFSKSLLLLPATSSLSSTPSGLPRQALWRSASFPFFLVSHIFTEAQVYIQHETEGDRDRNMMNTWSLASRSSQSRGEETRTECGQCREELTPWSTPQEHRTGAQLSPGRPREQLEPGTLAPAASWSSLCSYSYVAPVTPRT